MIVSKHTCRSFWNVFNEGLRGFPEKSSLWGFRATEKWAWHHSQASAIGRKPIHYPWPSDSHLGFVYGPVPPKTHVQVFRRWRVVSRDWEDLFSLKILGSSGAQLCCPNIPPAAFSIKEEGVFSFSLLGEMKGTNRDGPSSGSDSDGCQARWSPAGTTPKVIMQGAIVLGRNGSSVVKGPRARCLAIGTAWQAVMASPQGIPKVVRIGSVMLFCGRGAVVIYTSCVSLGWGPSPSGGSGEIMANMACYYWHECILYAGYNVLCGKG